MPRIDVIIVKALFHECHKGGCGHCTDAQVLFRAFANAMHHMKLSSFRSSAMVDALLTLTVSVAVTSGIDAGEVVRGVQTRLDEALEALRVAEKEARDGERERIG
jgi:hypothetical protein